MLLGLGASDCEALHHGLLAQPVNAWSSLAYILVGLGLVTRWPGSEPEDRPTVLCTAAIVASVGVGSLLYHGPDLPGSRWLHDLSVAGALGLVAAVDVSLVRARSAGHHSRTWLAGLVIGAVVLAVAPGISVPVTATLAVLVLGGEVALLRRGRRAGPSPPGRGYLVGVALLTLAVAAQVLGGTGAPLCDPDTALQGHGLWHVCSALALGAWTLETLDRSSSRPLAREGGRACTT